MKISTIVLMILNVAVWGGLVFLGRDLLQGVVQQHVPGYPNSEQVHYYFHAPIVILLFSVCWPLMAWRLQTWARNAVPMATLLFLPIYLFPYSGGM